MSEITRREGESLQEYKIRLMQNKDLYGLTWEDIRDILNDLTGEKWGESKYRKWWYAFDEGMQYAIENNINQIDVIKELENKKIEIEKEKIKFQDQRREFKKLLRDYARAEHIQEFIAQTAHEVGKMKPLIVYEKEEYKNNPYREGVALFSDWHTGLFVQNYWNSFNVEELLRRVRRLTVKIIEYGTLNQIRVLHLFLLGDLINGLIHVTTRINNTEDVIRQTQITAEIIAEMTKEFANNFEQIKLYTVRGNHDRVSARKEEEIAKESFVDFIPWYLKARLSHINNVEIVENKYDDEIIVTEVCGYKVAGVHGHRDRVNDVVPNLTLMTREFIDYVVMGHIHHNFSTETHGIEVIVNPSLSGVDDYAKEIRKTSKPSQKFLIFDKEESLLNTYSIRLDL